MMTLKPPQLMKGGSTVFLRIVIVLVGVPLAIAGLGAVVALLGTVATVAATVVMVTGLAIFIPAAPAMGARGWIIAGWTTLGLVILVDVLVALASIATEGLATLLGTPFTILLGALSLACVARALELAGVALETPALVARARSVESLVVVGASAVTAMTIGLMSTTPARHATHSDAGGWVAVVAGLAAFVVGIAVVVQHTKLLRATRDAIVAEVGSTP